MFVLGPLIKCNACGHNSGTDWGDIDYWALLEIWQAYHMAMCAHFEEPGHFL